MFTFKYEYELVRYIYENQEEYFYFKIIYNELHIKEFEAKIDLVGLDKKNIYLIEVKSEYISEDDFEKLVKIKNNMKMLKNIKGLLIGTRIDENLEDLIKKTKDIDYYIVEDVLYDSSLEVTRKHTTIPCPYDLELLVNVKYNYLIDFDRLIEVKSYEKFSVLTFKFNNALGINLRIEENEDLYYEVVSFDSINKEYYEVIKPYVKIREQYFRKVKTILQSFDYCSITSLNLNDKRMKFSILKKRLELAEEGNVIYDVYSMINIYMKNFRPLFTMYEKFKLEKEFVNIEKAYFDKVEDGYLIIARVILHDKEISFIRRKSESSSIGYVVDRLRERILILARRKFITLVDYINRKYVVENLYVIINNNVYEPLITIKEKNEKMIVLRFLIETKSNNKITWETSIYINEFCHGFLKFYLFLNGNLMKDFTYVVRRYLANHKTNIKKEYMKTKLTEEYSRITKFLNKNKIDI